MEKNKKTKKELIVPEHIDKFFQDVKKDAINKITKKDKDDNVLGPLLAFYSKEKGNGIVVIEGLTSETDKEMIFEKMGEKALQEVKDIEAICFIAEGWGSRVKQEDYDKGNYVMPSKSPERIEVLAVSAVDMNGFSKNYMAVIEKKGKEVVLNEDTFKEANDDNWSKKGDKQKHRLLDAFIRGYWKEYLKSNY